MFKQFNKTPVHAPAPKVVDLHGTAVIAPEPVEAEESQFVQPDPELLEHLELKSRLHDMLLTRLNLAVIEKVELTELRREAAGLIGEFLAAKNRPMRSEDFKRIVDELLNEVLGLGPLEPLLADPTINDILVNGHETVYVERSGVLELSRARFRDEKHLLRIIEKIVNRVGRRIDESNPWVDARLEDGSRVNAIIRPCAIDGPSMSIRKFSRSPLTMKRLVETGSLSPQAAQLLQGLVKARMNILISGGTGSGKTTMLNAMSASISPLERIVTIEDAAELRLQQPHWLPLETRPANLEGNGAIHMGDLVKNALRMRPDRIIMGEVRGAECFDLLAAMNTGHDGSMCTLHSNSPRECLGRMENMVLMGDIKIPKEAISKQIADSVDLIVQIKRLRDGSRRVTNVTEVIGMEGDVIVTQELFKFEYLDEDKDGKIIGEYRSMGLRPYTLEKARQYGFDQPYLEACL